MHKCCEMNRKYMSMWKSEEWVVRLELNCIGCHRLGGKFKLIKDSNFKLTWPNMHPTLTLAPLQPMKRPHDTCMHAWNKCWLLEEKQILESMIRRELRESTLNTWANRVQTLPVRVWCSITCFHLWSSFFMQACKNI